MIEIAVALLSTPFFDFLLILLIGVIFLVARHDRRSK